MSDLTVLLIADDRAQAYNASLSLDFLNDSATPSAGSLTVGTYPAVALTQSGSDQSIVFFLGSRPPDRRWIRCRWSVPVGGGRDREHAHPHTIFGVGVVLDVADAFGQLVRA